MSNSNVMLLYADVESPLLMEDMNQQNNATNVIQSFHSRARSQLRGESDSKGRNNHVLEM